MLETLVVLGLVLAVPFVLLALLLKLVWWLVTLPFRLLRAAFKLVGGLLAVLAALAAALVGIVLVPLVPVFLFFGVLWLLLRPRPAPRLATMT